MGKLTLLGAAVAGAFALWRAARSVSTGLAAPRRAPSSPSGVLGLVRGREVLADLDKLAALVELGRERGLEVLQSMLGGRTDRAA